MSDDRRHWLKVNRAPVLTLWAAVVAERLGFDRDEALTLGRAVAGLNAYSKGRSLGIFEPGEKKQVKEKKRSLEEGGTLKIDLLHRAVPATRKDGEIRALSKDEPVSPDSVRRYLEKKFGDALDETREAMTALAGAYRPQELADRAYALYEEFRPDVPAGRKGWGAEGRLYLDTIRRLADQAD
ncbi:MAG: hypothetical protein P8172_08100 [Gammaproteobacteria bacterium]|jgi:hypothetical protein